MRSIVLLAGLLAAAPAAAQDHDAADEPAPIRTPYRNVLIGGVMDWKPSFPGANTRGTGFFPLVAVWNDDERQPVETPDESIGINFLGDADSISGGLALTSSPRRRPSDVGLAVDSVGFGMEVGGFAQAWVGENLRLRAELRQGIGGHEALTGDVAADFVWRTANDDIMLTAGPRLRWASGGFNRAYFGVTQAEALATGLIPYRPGGGIYAYGGVASAHVHVTDAIGVYGYTGYDRLSGEAARSPLIARVGDGDQFSFGLGLSYRFQVRR